MGIKCVFNLTSSLSFFLFLSKKKFLFQKTKGLFSFLNGGLGNVWLGRKREGGLVVLTFAGKEGQFALLPCLPFAPF